MTNERIRQHYGFGAARLCLSPPLGGAPRAASTSLREELSELGHLRLSLRALPGLAVLVLSVLVIATLMRRPVLDDAAWLELVRVVPEPEPLVPEVVLEEPARPQPPLEQRAEPVPEPAPAPTELPVAAPGPRPSEPAVAPRRLAPPKLAVEPVPFAETMTESQLSEAPPLRTERQRPTPPRGLSVPRSVKPLEMPTKLAVRGPSRPLPQGTRVPRRPEARPTGIDAVQRIEPLAEAGDPHSSRRPMRERPSPRATRPTKSNGVVPASLAPAAQVLASPKTSLRVGLAAAPSTHEPRLRPGAGVAGVPLGSLAACLTDREENDLKLAVLSVVSGRGECTSSTGRYRFVETRNLAAFLMWIERPPSRAPADRCGELRLALECLGGGVQVGAIGP